MNDRSDGTLDVDVTDNLLRLTEEGGIGRRLIEAVAGDRTATEDERREIEQIKQQRGERFFSDLLFALTHQYFPYEAAEELWTEILDHKSNLSEALGREVGVSVASLDYLANIRRKLPDAGIISRDTIETIAETATRDGLTSLVDRTTFNALLAREVRRFERYGNPLSLIMLDIDDFKRINDEFGHARGDAVLVRVGQLLEEEIRDVDVPGRWGGEEFVVMLPQAVGDEAFEVAERLRARVEKELSADRLTISVGVATCPDHAKTTDELYRAADTALYAAKRGGKNRVVVAAGEGRAFDPLPSR
jgi:diguanylate cyclase (GGDEF)-like protein